VDRLAGASWLAADRRVAGDRRGRVGELGGVVGGRAVPGLLAGPLLAPVWVAGLVRLFRDSAVREFRFLAWAWAVLAVIFMATGGKPYYLAGLLPALIAAGAVPADGWLERGRRRLRRAVLVGGLAVSGAVSATIALPVLPADDAGPVVAVNEDVGETIGWPELARTVADVRRELPGRRRAVILTRNYGEAGAIDRFGLALGLPHAYSGHNAYGDWGPPPGRRGPVVTVGLHPDQLGGRLAGCTLAGQVDNRADIDNDEYGAPVMVCRGPVRPWAREWPSLRHLG
jgi:hypothetical protein